MARPPDRGRTRRGREGVIVRAGDGMATILRQDPTRRTVPSAGRVGRRGTRRARTRVPTGDLRR
ncbi:hypothetical protein GCM10023215_14030 [Pseudonocardia yuanmonensis]|uniref:Uncharacterized protein n=1 Tax=Pseudonocardia yuanmonensis TaxID=1095914 RepID=A0ABP8W4V7_9PSEU